MPRRRQAQAGIESSATLRSALRLPTPLSKTCAVVGSSGSLLYERLGAEIDAHDVVIRFNNAPTDGFAAIVGSRTTLRILNSHAAAAVLQACATFNHAGTCVAINSSCCPREQALLNSGRLAVANCFRRACSTDAPNVKLTLANHTLVDAFERRVRPKSVMTGVYGIAVASLLCTDRVDVYGMSVATASATAATSATPAITAAPAPAPRAPRYHYYDRCTHFATDGLDRSAAMMATRWFAKYSSSAFDRATIRVLQPKFSHPPFADDAAMIATSGPPGSGHAGVVRQLPPCPERSGIAIISKFLQRSSGRNTSVRCCTAAENETGIAGRCSYFADRGLCRHYGTQARCPVACEGCLVCAGHPLRAAYLRIFRRMSNPPFPRLYNVSSRRMRSMHGTRSLVTQARMQGLTVFSRRNRSV